jgi:hypothetical protein
VSQSSSQSVTGRRSRKGEEEGEGGGDKLARNIRELLNRNIVEAPY